MKISKSSSYLFLAAPLFFCLVAPKTPNSNWRPFLTMK